MDFIKVLKGMACGIVYVSSFFWTIVLTFIYIDSSPVIVLVSATLTNVIVGLLLASIRHRYAFYKWLISLPVGIITFLMYRQTNFIDYWLNKVFAGYGRLSAGGGFALLLYIMLYVFSFLIAIIVSYCITSREKRKLASNEL